MDLRMAPTTAERDENSRDHAFFTYILQLQKLTMPSFFDSSVWIWIHVSDVRARQSANFLKRYMLEYETVHSLYRFSKNKCLNDAKTQAPPTTINILFLFKQGSDCATRLW